MKKYKLYLVVLFLITAFMLLFAVQFYSTVKSLKHFVPLSVIIKSPKLLSDEINIYGKTLSGNSVPLVRYQGSNKWVIEKRPLRSIVIPEEYRDISIIECNFIRSRLPLFKELINWPGDLFMLRLCMRWPLAFLLISITYILFLKVIPKKTTNSLVCEYYLKEVVQIKNSDSRLWFWGGFLFLVGAFVFMEVRSPYYFTQADNYIQFLPTILHGCESFFNGVFPTINPHQLMGAQSSSLGVYALTYPLTYLSYLLAKYVVGQEYATLEIFALLHLLLGYFASYFMMRSQQVRASIAMSGSLCWLLSGFTLIAGRSWYYMMPMLLWLPLLLLMLSQLFYGKYSVKWSSFCGFMIGLFFHSGNAQMWAYSMMFFCILVLLAFLSGKVNFRSLLFVFGALLIGVTIASPLLVSQLLETGSIARSGGKGGSVLRGLLSMVLPYPLTTSSHPDMWGSENLKRMGQFYYSGTLYFVMGFISLILIPYVIYYSKYLKRFVCHNLYLVSGAVAFILALGADGLLWIVLSKMPLFNKFNYPFKILPFVTLFMIISGAVLLEKIFFYRRISHWKSNTIVGLVMLLLIYHIGITSDSFYSFSTRPYPQKVSAFELDKSSRLMSFSPLLSMSDKFVMTLNRNFATLYDLYSINGYDPLVTATRENKKAMANIMSDPVEALRAYGIRYIIESYPDSPDYFSNNPLYEKLENLDASEEAILAKLKKESRVVASHEGVHLWEIQKAEPMAFSLENPSVAHHVSFDASGAHVDMKDDSKLRKLVVNILFRPGMIAMTKGKDLSAKADRWGRMLVEVPDGVRSIDIKYVSFWKEGIIIGLGLSVLTVGYLLLLIKLKLESPS